MTTRSAGRMRATGLSRVVTTTEGTLTARGTVNGDKVQASAFDVRYKDGGKKKLITIDFADGNVIATDTQPPVKKRDDWVPVIVSKLNGVLDPIAASLIAAPDMRAVCNRTIDVFDGTLHSRIKLRYLRTIPFSARGYDGDAVTCSADFVPVAGYSPKRAEIRYARDKLRMEISFASIGERGFYAPVKARAQIEGIAINMTATRFEQLTN